MTHRFNRRLGGLRHFWTRLCRSATLVYLVLVVPEHEERPLRGVIHDAGEIDERSAADVNLGTVHYGGTWHCGGAKGERAQRQVMVGYLRHGRSSRGRRTHPFISKNTPSPY